MARLRDSGWFKAILARIDDGSIVTGDRPLLMIPGRQSPEPAGADFDPTGFTAYELSAEAAWDPDAMAGLVQLVERHEKRLCDSLRAAVAELPEMARRAADLNHASEEARDRIQDLAARYGLAAALAGGVRHATGRSPQGNETPDGREASSAASRDATVIPFPGHFSPQIIEGYDPLLRSLSIGVLTGNDRARRDVRVKRDLGDLFPDRLPSVPELDPGKFVDAAWRARGREISDQARRAMHRNDGHRPSDAEIRESSRTGPPGGDLPIGWAPATAPESQRARRRGTAAQPSALRRVTVRAVRKLGQGK